MGDAVDIIAPGVSDLVEGDIVGAATGGITGGVGDLIGGDIGALINSSGESLVTGGISNLQAGLSQNNFYDAMDHIIDPSRVNDRWIRASGELLGKDGRDIMGHYVLPAVGAIAGSFIPVAGTMAGAAAGKYFGGKVAGDSDRANGEGALMAAGTAAASGLASPYISGVAQGAGLGETAANVVGSAASQAGVNAAASAAQGQDPLDGAAAGALGGALSGMAGPITNSLGSTIDMGQVGYGIAGGATGAASNAISQAALNGTVSPMGLIGGAAGGAYSGYKSAPTLPDVMEVSRPDSEAGFTQSLGYNPNEISQADYLRSYGLFGKQGESQFTYDDYPSQAMIDKGTANDTANQDYSGESRYDGLTGKLVKGVAGSLADYFYDQANKSSLKDLPSMQFYTNPDFAGLLKSAANVGMGAAGNQTSKTFDWQRTLMPTTDGTESAVLRDTQPILNIQPTKDIGSSIEDTVSVIENTDNAKQKKVKAAFKSKPIAGFNNLA